MKSEQLALVDLFHLMRVCARTHTCTQTPSRFSHRPACSLLLPCNFSFLSRLPLSAFFEQIVRGRARILRSVFRGENFGVVGFPAPKQTEPLEHRRLALFGGSAVVQERGAARAPGAYSNK